MTLALPENGVYFDLNEPNAFAHKIPLDPIALDKFDRVNDLSRIYDSGNLVIYDSEKYIGISQTK